MPRTRRRPAPRPAAAPVTGRGGPSRAAARRTARIAATVGSLLVAVVAGLFSFGWWQFGRIDKVAVSSLSASGRGGTNYLIVGSDSRRGVDPSAPNAGAFLGEAVSGERTDTIIVLRVEGSKSSLLSIPRDLWVKNPVTGEMGRINSVYQSGPAALVRAVRDLGIPVQHYLQIDFVSFAKLVDAVGGITVQFPHPARDTHSGLDVPKAGAVTLDGAQALAYVRSRYYEELVDGVWRTDPTADLGRVERQREFLQALMNRMASTRNPWTLARLASAMGGGMRIDDRLTYFDALGLLWNLRGGFRPESFTLPVTNRTTSGGAAVLDLDVARARPLISRFGG
ncbi:MAG: LCP family protein [Acidimicrobiales bacterium]|jgi:LCP family protein required for cell wall assembly